MHLPNIEQKTQPSCRDPFFTDLPTTQYRKPASKILRFYLISSPIFFLTLFFILKFGLGQAWLLKIHERAIWTNAQHNILGETAVN